MAVRIVHPRAARHGRSAPRGRLLTALVNAVGWALATHDDPRVDRAQALVWFALLFVLALALAP